MQGSDHSSRSLKTRPHSTYKLPDGFTLVEILVVIGIIALLASVLIVAIGNPTRVAYQEGTKALMMRVRNAMDTYQREFGEYPPDGYGKTPVYTKSKYMNGERIQLKGTQCLIYFLAWRNDTLKKGRFKLLKLKHGDEGGDKRWVSANNGVPYLEGLEKKHMKEKDGYYVLIDAWGNEIMYDNIAGGYSYSDTEAEVPDPRRDRDGKSLRQPATFDLWSTGGNMETTEGALELWGINKRKNVEEEDEP